MNKWKNDIISCKLRTHIWSQALNPCECLKLNFDSSSTIGHYNIHNTLKRRNIPPRNFIGKCSIDEKINKKYHLQTIIYVVRYAVCVWSQTLKQLCKCVKWYFDCSFIHVVGDLDWQWIWRTKSEYVIKVVKSTSLTSIDVRDKVFVCVVTQKKFSVWNCFIANGSLYDWKKTNIQYRYEIKNAHNMTTHLITISHFSRYFQYIKRA